MASAVGAVLAVLLVSTLINCAAAISDPGAIAVLSIILVIFLIICVVLLGALIVFCWYTSGKTIPLHSWWSKRGSYDLEQSNNSRSSGEFTTASVRLQLRRKPSMTPEMSPVDTVPPVSFGDLPQIRVYDEVTTTQAAVAETALYENSENLQSIAPEKNSMAEDDIFVDEEVASNQSTVNGSSSKFTYPAVRVNSPDDQPQPQGTPSPVTVQRLVSISSTTIGPTSPIPSPLPPVSEDVKELDFTTSSVSENSALQGALDSSHTTEPPPSYFSTQSQTLPRSSTPSKAENLSGKAKAFSSSQLSDDLFASIDPLSQSSAQTAPSYDNISFSRPQSSNIDMKECPAYGAVTRT